MLARSGMPVFRQFDFPAIFQAMHLLMQQQSILKHFPAKFLMTTHWHPDPCKIFLNAYLNSGLCYSEYFLRNL